MKTIFKERLSEKEIIEGCINGSQAAMEKLFSIYNRKLKGLAYRYARNTSDQDDILQEGFIKIFLNIKTFNFEGSFEGWCKRIVINTAINHYKKFLKYNVEVNYEMVNESEMNAVALADNLDTDELIFLINKLPDKYRLIIQLFAIDGYSHKEIAQMLKIEESSSSSQYSRAKKMLVSLINQNQ